MLGFNFLVEPCIYSLYLLFLMFSVKNYTFNRLSSNA